MENGLKIIVWLLPAALGLDLALPFLFAPFYKGYSHHTQVMSVLGSAGSPLRRFYNLWLVVLGVILLIGALFLYPAMADISVPLASLFAVITAVYGIGGCILSGLFAVGETKEMVTSSAKIHGFGAAVGFMAFLFAGLVVSVHFAKANEAMEASVSLTCFCLAVLFFTLFIMADKPAFKDTVISFEGLWQRLSLLFMYLPVVLLCIKNIV